MYIKRSAGNKNRGIALKEWERLCAQKKKNIIDQMLGSGVTIASYPGSQGEEKESLVTSVCACA